MGNSPGFVEFALERLEAAGRVQPRRMFGGHGIYAAGRMFALIADDVLYLKADSVNRAALLAEGGQPFKPFEGKSMVMPYISLTEEALEDEETLVRLARGAIDAALRAPDKKKAKGKRT